MKTRYKTIFRQWINLCSDNITALLCALADFLQMRLSSAVKSFTLRFPKATAFLRSLTPRKLFAFLCMISVFSQIDFLAEIPAIRMVVIAFWFLAFLFFAAKSHLQLGRNVLSFLVPLVVFDLLIFMTGLFKGNLIGYIGSPITYSANLSAFVFLTGALAASLRDRKMIVIGAKVYILCAAVLAVYTILTSFSGVWFSSETYIYPRKNSLAPIILTAVCCVMFLRLLKTTTWHVLFLAIFISFIALLKSRASVVGLAVAFIVWYVWGTKDKRTRLYALLFVFAALLAIAFIPPLRQLIIGNILLNNRAAQGLNAVSSGRLEQFTETFLVLFPKAPFFGNGSVYIESLPLASLLSFGLFATIPLTWFAAAPLRVAFLQKNPGILRPYVLFLRAISLAFIVNCFFEERAPFGPGSTYFFFWFTCGFVDGTDDAYAISIHG